MRPWRSIAGELIVPALVLAGCVLFWWHIQEARSVAQRVPNGVLILVIGLTGLVLFQTLFARSRADEGAGEAERLPALRVLAVRGGFVGLCLLYYLSFEPLGFNLANALFLVLAFPLAGLSLRWVLPATAIACLIFWALATVMEFNVPMGPLGF